MVMVRKFGIYILGLSEYGPESLAVCLYSSMVLVYNLVFVR
jgi:hypothetical protein